MNAGFRDCAVSPKETHHVPAGPANESRPCDDKIDFHAAWAGMLINVGNEEGDEVNDHDAQLDERQHIAPESPVLPAGSNQWHGHMQTRCKQP